MAKDKKEFRIVINGLSESVDAVKTLNKELDELSSKIKSLQNAKINVKVQGNTTTNKNKVSGNSSGTDSETQKQIDQQNALAKLQQQLANQRAKAEAMVTDEYKKQFQELQKVKQANKDNETIQKQLASGVKDVNGEYANTLAGQRAYLSELQKIFNQQEIGTEEWKRTADELTRVRNEVKQIEISTGDWRRNVGNYPSAVKDLIPLMQQYNDEVQKANDAIAEMNESMKGMSEGSEEYKAAVVQLGLLNDKLVEAQNNASAVNDELSKKISLDVGGEVQYFDSLRDAAKQLTAQLQDMYLKGETNTKKFQQTITTLGRVRTAITNVNNEITSFVGNSKGLQDTVTVMQGLASVASLGVGLQGLFGGQNKELDEGLKKFTALTLIMNGLSQIQKQMNDETDAFGIVMTKVFDKVNNASKAVGNFADKLGKIPALFKLTNGNVDEFIVTWNSKLIAAIKNAPPAVDAAFQQLNQEMQNFRDNFQQDVKFLDLFQMDEKDIEDKFGKPIADAFAKLKESFKMADMDEANEAIEQLGQLSEIAGDDINGLTQQMNGMSKVTINIRNGLSKLIAGIRGFLTSAAIIGLVVLAIQALQWAFEGLTKLVNHWSGNDEAKLVEGFDGLAASIQNANDKLEDLNRTIDRRAAQGEINAYQALKEKLDGVTQSAEAAKQSLVDFAREMDNTASLALKDSDELLKPFESDSWFNGDATVKGMEAFRSRYKILVKAVLQGVDEVKAATGKGDWYLTASDARTDLARMQKAIIGDIQAQLNGLDFTQGEEAYRKFIGIINEETNASALANIDKLFGDDEWQKGLKKRIDAYRNFAEQMYGLQTQLAQNETNLTKKIQDNEDASIEDAYQRQEAQRKRAYERELADAEGKEELKASITKRYNRETLDAQKAHNKQVASEAKSARQKALQKQYAAQQAEIDLMNEGFAKQKALLELQKKQALDSAADQGLSKQTILNITEKYDREILKLEKQFSKDIEQLYKDRNKALLELEMDYLNSMKDIERSLYDRRMNIRKQMEEFGQEDFEFNLSIKDLKNYYQTLEESQQEHLLRKKNMEIAEANESHNRELADEKERLADREKYYTEWLEQQEETLKGYLEQGLITQSDYDSMLAVNKQQANTQLEAERAAYNANIQQLEEDHNLKMLEIDRNYTSQQRETAKKGYDNLINLIKENLSEIEQIGEMRSKSNKSSIGIINYSKERQNLKKMKEDYNNVLTELEARYKQLQNMLDNNQISFNDFNKAKKELDGLVKNTKDKAKENDRNLKNLFNDTVQSVMQATQQYVNAFSSVWGQINSLFEADLDAMEDKLDREQELLDKELEMIEEKYSKQEEITKQYSDNINNIEDELKDARGDRREALIDQLAKQRQAQIESMNTEKEIQKEKEANAKKQEQLEKQQKALEKKRWEQDKKNKIVQATINTFTAVSNALSVQPWFLGLALSGVALALGLANVAKISSQKYYADGGLLTGPSHSRGGIKIPGTGIEVEGQEYVVNKVTTSYNQPLIEYINSKRRPLTRADMMSFYDNGYNPLISRTVTSKFADGGQLPTMGDVDVREMVNYNQPQDNAQYVVSVVDIINASDNVRQIQTLAGLHQ